MSEYYQPSESLFYLGLCMGSLIIVLLTTRSVAIPGAPHCRRWAEASGVATGARYAGTLVRACLKLSRLEHALEAHAGHEQRGEHGHVPRGLVAHLVVDAQAAVALQATERLLDLPTPRLDDEALAADRADELPDDAVAGEELTAALGGEAEVHPGQAQRGGGGEGRAEGGGA